MSILSIENGVINYPNSNKKLLDVDININENDVCVFVGKNGSGKTTFFDTLIGFRKFHTKSLFENYSNSVIGYCLQDFNGGLFPWLNIVDNILLPNQLKSDKNIDDLAKQYLNKFNLYHKKNDYPYQLSGGQKQVINIIRTLCTPSELFLFDEPFSALHSDNKKIAISLIKEIKKTTLIATHSVTDITDIQPNRCFILDNNIEETNMNHLIRFLKNEEEK